VKAGKIVTTRDTCDIEEAKKMDLMDIYEKLIQIAKWHAQLQIEFERQLLKELEVSD
jgi:hypothetical protein